MNNSNENRTRLEVPLGTPYFYVHGYCDVHKTVVHRWSTVDGVISTHEPLRFVDENGILLKAENTNEFLVLGLDCACSSTSTRGAAGTGGSRRSGIELAMAFAAAASEEANVTFFFDLWGAGVDEVRAAQTTTSGLGGVLAKKGRRRLSSGLPTSFTRHSRNDASSISKEERDFSGEPRSNHLL